MVGQRGRSWLASPPHRTLPFDGCTNCGLMKEKFANSVWSMLAMTSSSGGVSWGCVRVKNLSKFSAALPHWKRGTQEKVYAQSGRQTSEPHPQAAATVAVGLRCSTHSLGDDVMCADRTDGCPSSTCPHTHAHLILAHVRRGGDNIRSHAPHLIHLKHGTAKQRRRSCDGSSAVSDRTPGPARPIPPRCRR